MAQVVALLLSVLIRWIANRIPTNSASCTVCSDSFPRWRCKIRSSLFFLISIAAAPTLPFCTEPSEYTCISSVAFVASRAESSLLAEILIWKGSLPVMEGLRVAVGIFSILLASMLKVLASFWSGPLCLLVVRVLFQFTGLYKGWSLGIVVILTYALWHHLLIASGAGRR